VARSTCVVRGTIVGCCVGAADAYLFGARFGTHGDQTTTALVTSYLMFSLPWGLLGAVAGLVVSRISRRKRKVSYWTTDPDSTGARDC
jgi:hypothetical protein